MQITLLAFIVSCTKQLDLKLAHKHSYFVYGEIDNKNSRVFISDLASTDQSFVKSARVYIEQNEVRHQFQLTDSLYELRNVYLEPNFPYTLIVEINNERSIYYGMLPDTVKKANLVLNQIKDFRYEFKLDIEVEEPSSDYGFIWGPTNYYNNPISYGRGLSYAYEPTFFKKIANNEFYVARTNPLLYNTDYYSTVKRTSASTIDALKLDSKVFDNKFNPLYIKHNPEIDIVNDKFIYRIYETVSIQTNTVRVEDSTSLLMKCNIYSDSGTELNEETYKNLRFNISFANERTPSFDISMGKTNPTTISLNQLSYLLNWGSNDDLDFNELLNRPFTLWIQGEDTDGRRVGYLEDFTLNNLSSTKELTINLLKE